MGNPSKIKCAFITTDARGLFGIPVLPEPLFGTAPTALLQGLAACPDVEVHVVSVTRQPMRSPEKLSENIFCHNLVVPKIGWLQTFYQGCIRATRKKLKEIQPDIVHGQGTERDCAISAVFSGYPNIITIHGNMRLIARLNGARPFSHEWLTARVEGFTIPRAGGVVCITNYTRAAVDGLARRTWVAPNAVNLKFFGLDASPDPAQTPMILYIGDVCPRKNQNAFIRALEPLALERKFKVVFFGRATRGQKYDDEFFHLLGENPWCTYAGTANHEEIIGYLKNTSLLSLASLEDNCPMVVLEAMAAGVPVVASKVGGVPDLIEDGKNGLFCNPLDAESIRAAVAKILDDPGLGRRLAAEAKRRALERFHPVVVARRHLEIYREVLKTRS
jgi:glycosyltransferase involved in cell wall biosynthesis